MCICMHVCGLWCVCVCVCVCVVYGCVYMDCDVYMCVCVWFMGVIVMCICVCVHIWRLKLMGVLFVAGG